MTKESESINAASTKPFIPSKTLYLLTIHALVVLMLSFSSNSAVLANNILPFFPSDAAKTAMSALLLNLRKIGKILWAEILKLFKNLLMYNLPEMAIIQ